MIEIRNLRTIDEFKKLIPVQMSAWEYPESETEPHHLMVRVQKYGGLIQGLFLDGELIGFTYAILGQWQGGQYGIRKIDCIDGGSLAAGLGDLWVAG